MLLPISAIKRAADTESTETDVETEAAIFPKGANIPVRSAKGVTEIRTVIRGTSNKFAASADADGNPKSAAAAGSENTVADILITAIDPKYKTIPDNKRGF